MTIARSTPVYNNFPLACAAALVSSRVRRISRQTVNKIFRQHGCSDFRPWTVDWQRFSRCRHRKVLIHKWFVLCQIGFFSFFNSVCVVVCVCVPVPSIFNPHKMKKIFSKFEKNEKIESANRETNSYVGKVFTVGRTTVTVEDILAEGNFVFSIHTSYRIAALSVALYNNASVVYILVGVFRCRLVSFAKKC